MDNVEQSLNWVDLIKAVGPYIVAVAGMAFGFIQTKRVAEITRDKDIEIANFLQKSLISKEKLKTQTNAAAKLQALYSPVFAKVESIFHNYCGLVSSKKSIEAIKSDLEKFVVDDYISLSVESRKAVLAETIAICQLLEDHKAYELAVKLDNKITEALSLVDFSGISSGIAHLEEIKEVQKQYGLLYVSFFYRVANSISAANK